MSPSRSLRPDAEDQALLGNSRFRAMLVLLLFRLDNNLYAQIGIVILIALAAKIAASFLGIFVIPGLYVLHPVDVRMGERDQGKGCSGNPILWNWHRRCDSLGNRDRHSWFGLAAG